LFKSVFNILIVMLFFSSLLYFYYRLRSYRLESYRLESKINKTIWMFWEQGWNDAPEICKICLKSWLKYNPDWNIQTLDGSNIADFINLEQYVKNYKSKRPIQMRADILRTNLLNQHGGLWVDATVFCTKPLNDWIYPYIKEGFFAFEKNDKVPHLISNWLLYAEPNNYIINTWATKYNSYWKNKETSEYFRHAYMFDDLYKNNNTFYIMWNNIKKLSASIPHKLKYKDKHSSIPAHIKKHINKVQSPLYKLDHNPKTSEVIKDNSFENVYSYLLKFHRI
jgi:hypothetical protein